MGREYKNGQSRFNPSMIADRANNGFVGFGQILMRAVNFPRDYLTMVRTRQSGAGHGERGRRGAAGAGRGDRAEERPVKGGFGGGPEDPEKAKSTFAEPSRSAGEGIPMDVFQKYMKDLFSEDSLRRVSAIRWVRHHRVVRARATLESVLLIEEDGKNRDEIVYTLSVLNSLNSKGEDHV
jgi:hypothetical protein